MNQHLMYRKLLALGDLSLYSLQKLLGCLSLKIVTFDKDDTDSKEDKAAKAISTVLAKNPNKVKKLFSKLNTASSKLNVIYQNLNDNVFNEKIEAEFLDTSSLTKILLQIETYPVSYPINRTDVTCKGQYHSSRLKKNCCCVDQSCESSSECLHPNCGSDDRDCSKINYVCCYECRLCMKCTLVILGVLTWHELVGKIVGGERIAVCDILLLRLSISIIKSFRNFIFHSTPDECRAIDNGTISDSKISQYCKSWVDIQDHFQFAIEQVLIYLKSEDEYLTHTEMKQHMEYMRSVTTATRHSDLDAYTKNTTKYWLVEQFSLNKMAKTSLKIVVEFKLKKYINFSLKNSKPFYDSFQKGMREYFDTEIGTDTVTARLVRVINGENLREKKKNIFPT